MVIYENKWKDRIVARKSNKLLNKCVDASPISWNTVNFLVPIGEKRPEILLQIMNRVV